MRKLIFFTTVLTLFLLLPAPITWAQTISSQKGLTTANFTTKFGTIKVYLPDDIRPGDHISGTIIAEPSGKNAAQTGKNLSELKKYKVVIAGKNFAVSEKPESFNWLVQLDRKLFAPIELMDVSGVQKFQLPVFIEPVSSELSKQYDQCIIPQYVLAGSPLVIKGSFDGDISNTRCMLDSKPLEVLAESPRQCILQYPQDARGIKTLTINDSKTDPEKKCESKISGVGLEVSAGKLNLLKGEKTNIDVKVSGLDNLKDTAVLTLINKTPLVVKLLPANYIIIPLAPSDVPAAAFSKMFDVQSIKTGGFTIDVNLDLPGEKESDIIYDFDLRDQKNESGYSGSYGYIGDQPCEPEGATVKWRWHKTFACEIDGRQVLPCGHSKEGNDVYEKIKELLEELELDKATDIGEKMAKAFSTAKTFSYSIHVIRKWVDYDIEYKCVNGKWQPTGGVYVKHGTDDLGWHSVKHLSTGCWMTFDSPAAEKEFEEALENALRAACAK